MKYLIQTNMHTQIKKNEYKNYKQITLNKDEYKK